MTIIANTLQAIQINIRESCLMANRDDEIKLLAVSKSQPADKLREAYVAGQRAFGAARECRCPAGVRASATQTMGQARACESGQSQAGPGTCGPGH
jgi:uncharacterized pyridoxal phosphate-containing UPF0001 family protein